MASLNPAFTAPDGDQLHPYRMLPPFPTTPAPGPASGRLEDQHDAPLDPNFDGVGQIVTNQRGEFHFLTIKPDAYLWRDTYNSWRPAHIHFGIFGPLSAPARHPNVFPGGSAPGV
jgi:hypothetical protein